jgi:hypothetical protein
MNKEKTMKRTTQNYSIVLPDKDLKLLREMAEKFELTWSGQGSISKLLKAICRGDIELTQKTKITGLVKTVYIKPENK